MKMRNLNLHWPVAAILAFVAGYFQFHHPLPTSSSVTLSFTLKVNQFNTFLLAVDGRMQGKFAKGGGGLQNFAYTIPNGDFRELKFILGRNPDRISFKSISIRGFLKQHTWNPGELSKLFVRNSGISGTRIEKEEWILDSRGQDQAFLQFSERLNPIFEEMRNARFSPFWQALLAGFFIFFLTVAIDLPGTWRRFRLHRSWVPIFFIGFLFFPLADEWLHFSSRWAIQEKRAPAPKPVLRLDDPVKYPGQYERYYGDHFGLRSLLIRLYSRFKVNWLHVSPNSYVLLGREGWLFLDRETPKCDVIDYFLGVSPFSPEELENWAGTLRKRRDWLKRQNCEYLLVFAPDKTSIYPEYLPPSLRNRGGRTRLDQLQEALKEEKKPFLLDIRSALREAKQTAPVYDRTDTHWNEWGGYIAYHEIIRHLSRGFPGLHPLPLTAFRWEQINQPGGDLAVMLTMPEVFQEFSVKRVSLFSFAARKILLPPFPVKDVTWSGYEHPDRSLPRAVVLRDSYAHQFLDLIPENFSRIIYIWDFSKRFFPGIMRKEAPQVVIEEMSERFLMNFRPNNPPAVTFENKE